MNFNESSKGSGCDRQPRGTSARGIPRKPGSPCRTARGNFPKPAGLPDRRTFSQLIRTGGDPMDQIQAAGVIPEGLMLLVVGGLGEHRDHLALAFLRAVIAQLERSPGTWCCLTFHESGPVLTETPVRSCRSCPEAVQALPEPDETRAPSAHCASSCGQRRSATPCLQDRILPSVLHAVRRNAQRSATAA